MSSRRGLGFGGFRLEAEKGEEVGDGVVGGLGRVIGVHAVKVVDEVAQENQEERPEDHLHGVGCPIEVPHARRRAEAHGEVEPQGDPRRSRQEGAAVPRVANRPLAIGVLKVVAKDHGIPAFRPGPEDQVDDVPQEVVGGHVGRPHGGVVPRPAPVLTPAQLEVAVLVDLTNGEGEGRKAVPRRGLSEGAHPSH